MNTNEKNEHVLEHLRNRVLLSQRNTFYIVLGDFLVKGISVAEIVTILDRLQREGFIKVISANTAEKDSVTMDHKILSFLSVRKRDLSILSRNELDGGHALEILVNSCFLDLISELNSDLEESQILVQVLLHEVDLNFPIEIFCPSCRSRVCEIKDIKEWKKIQLDFLNGETVKCIDRRHACTFYAQGANIIIKINLNKAEDKKAKIDDKNKKK